MATGSISSLGIASGTLTSDIIDQLKEADTASFVKPYETKIKTNETQTEDLGTIKTMAKELATLSSKLASVTTYAGVKTNVSGSGATVTAEAGANVQDFTLNVTQLAQKQITQSQGFSSKDTALGQSTDLTFTIGSDNYTVNVTDTMSLSEIKDLIYEKTEGKVVASSLNTGGTNPYSLVLKSAQSGTDNGFQVTDSGNVFNFTEQQGAQNAEFTYDGVNITRSSNTVDDLISGVTIKLQNAQTSDDPTGGKTTVSITRDTSSIVTDVEEFVKKYNELMDNLNAVTKYDSEEKTRGTFQGNSEMNSIKSQIKSAIINADGVMSNFGIEMERDGTITLDTSTLETKLKNNFDEVKNYFQGSSDGTTKSVGLFSSLDDTFDDMMDSSNGLFKLLENELKTQNTSLTESKEKAEQKLEDKYEIMSTKFASYDAMISKLNSSFSALQMIINQSTAQDS